MLVVCLQRKIASGSPVVKEVCLLLTAVSCTSMSVEAVDVVSQYKNLKKCDRLS